MGETRGAFEVADGEFAHGVVAVVSVGFDRVGVGVGVGVGVPGVGVVVLVCVGCWMVEVGDEGVVAPVGPQPTLGACEAGAAHYETQFHSFGSAGAMRCPDGGLRDLGYPVVGVVDPGPGVFADPLDCFPERCCTGGW